MTNSLVYCGSSGTSQPRCVWSGTAALPKGPAVSEIYSKKALSVSRGGIGIMGFMMSDSFAACLALEQFVLLPRRNPLEILTGVPQAMWQSLLRKLLEKIMVFRPKIKHILGQLRSREDWEPPQSSAQFRRLGSPNGTEQNFAGLNL